MTKVNLFEVATKEAYRFNYRGVLSVEDLWQLSVGHLDEIYKALNKEAKELEGESLLQTKSVEDTVLNNKIEIVKYIVEQKLEENKLRLEERENREKRQRILEILSNKEDQELLEKSPEELKEMLNNL